MIAPPAEDTDLLLQTLLDTAPAGVAVFDRDLRFTRVNERFAAMHRCPAGEHPGRTLRDFSPRMAELVEPLLLRVFQNGKPILNCRIDDVIPTEANRSRSWIASYHPVRGGSGEVRGVLAQVREYVPRESVEEDLRRTEERFRRLYDSNLVGVAFWNVDGDVTEANDEYLRIVGWTREEFRAAGRIDWRGLTPPEYEALDDRAIRESLRDGASGVYEKAYLRRDGTRVPIVLGIALLNDSRHDGVAFVLNITERKGMEHALRESEERFRTLAEAVPQIVWVTRPDGWHEYYNHRWYRYTGLTQPESIGWGWSRPLHPDDRIRSEMAWEEAVNAGEAFEIEYRLRGADGAYRWFLGRALPVYDRTGRIERWFGTCTDIDDQKRAMEELTEADRRKDEFIAMLGHELRNPLAAISNALAMLRSGTGDEESRRRALEIVERQVKHQTRLIDDLLDVSRIHRGKIELRNDPLDLVQTVRETLEDHRTLMEQGGLELDLHLPNEPLRMRGDATRLSQILGNLLHNAAKFTDGGGRVQVRLTADASDPYATLRVADTGIGMEPELLPHIFDTFTQADRSLARSRGGMGLGLALVKGLAERHGGTVEAHSDGVGKGAAFTLRFPLDATAFTPVTEPGSALHENIGRLRVLIIEDNEDAAESLRDLLEMCGHEVFLASTGPTGIDSARRHWPAVVLCDLGLPGMDGYGVARALREDPDLTAATLIAISGYGGEEDRRRSEEAGFDLHFIKPVDLEYLLDQLNRIS